MNPEAMEPARGLEDGLAFDRAEFNEGARRTLSCGFCNQDLYKNYFEVNGRTACERCRYEVEQQLTGHSPGMRFTRAFAAGMAAAGIGAAIWYAVAALTGYEFGLIAVAVGVLVGYAVRWGSRGTGGWVYQSLAIFLTYMSIVSTYVPTMIAEMQKMAESDQQVAVVQQSDASAESVEVSESTSGAVESDTGKVTLGGMIVGFSALLVLAAAIPFLGGFENIIGLLIIGFALYEAWKINRRTPLQISGPYRIGDVAAAGDSSATS